MADQDGDELRRTKPPWDNPRVRNWATWRPVVARVSGAWRWAVVRDWATIDGRVWICHLMWGDDDVRGGAQSGWFVYDPQLVRLLEPLPPDWRPPDRPLRP